MNYRAILQTIVKHLDDSAYIFLQILFISIFRKVKVIFEFVLIFESLIVFLGCR